MAARQHAWTHSLPCFQPNWADDPICVFTDTTFAAGRGISLVTTPRRANYVATTPAFAEPETVGDINQDLGGSVPAKYEMRELPGKGMGLIATAHIRRGEPIMANTASLMIDYRAFNELTKPEYKELQAHAVDNLPASHRALVLGLSTHTSSPLPHIELVDRIAATNGFDIDPDETDTDQHHSFFVLFPSIARMNHDCRPNAEYVFDHGTLSQVVNAARDIAPGEELTLGYINPLMPRAQRLAKLKRNWGFDCGCASCTLERARADESDARIAQIEKLKGELREWGPDSRACPEMAELLIALYDMENMWTAVHEAYTLAALEFNAVGEPWTAVKYARMAVEFGIPMVGEADDDMGEMAKVAEDPWSHWSWERRVRGENSEGASS
ncbi:hypothetical protein C8A05DRAFT_46945 [Staphylotrichum tortipilum]|uniref:SET domain-containing protein n=1 Tax=Staphylotrichum tortipilum TaxID=2831512 RepID=A0AAN6MD94_9PEZI|nr:hypothetical protein C8A05DRAFT_46945 [Staphylotrichum longicolle]